MKNLPIYLLAALTFPEVLINKGVKAIIAASRRRQDKIAQAQADAHRQVVAETLRVKRVLDDQAFLARQALLKAAAAKNPPPR